MITDRWPSSMKDRFTAIRATIDDLVNGEYGDDGGPRVVSPHGIELRRVLLLGQIVENYVSDNFASITLDDGTGTIRAKAWGAEASALEAVESDILALVIGKVREYEGELYVVPEIVKRVEDPNFIPLHKLERQRTHLLAGKKEKSTSAPTSAKATGKPKAAVQQSMVSKSLGEQIIDFLRANDSPKGVHVSQISDFFVAKGFDKSEINMEVIELTANDQIVEPSVGVYRLPSL
jgi:RPA family protein